ALQQRCRVHLARGRRDQHGLLLAQIPSTRELLSERRERERDRPPHSFGVCGREHRQPRLRRPRWRRPQWLHPLLGRESRDRLPIGLAFDETKFSPEHWLPFRDDRQGGHDPLGGEVAAGTAELVVEDRLVGFAHPWMSQPSAARPASITASDRVGWPWIVRATSGNPPSSARTLTNSWISSVARVPTICPPRSSPYLRSPITFTSPVLSP